MRRARNAAAKSSLISRATEGKTDSTGSRRRISVYDFNLVNPAKTRMKVIVVGAGINGVVAAIELRTRGHNVVLIDPGPLPHPLAASTDISKAVRAAYGSDADYTELAERSIQGWREWNAEFGLELYHEIGFLFLRRQPMEPGDFEYESFRLLEQRGHRIERMNSDKLRERFPAWIAERYPDGFLDLEAGYAESGRVVAALVQRAKSIGVELWQGSKFAA